MVEVTDNEQMNAAAAKIAAITGGKLDVLINNAGGGGRTPQSHQVTSTAPTPECLMNGADKTQHRTRYTDEVGHP